MSWDANWEALPLDSDSVGAGNEAIQDTRKATSALVRQEHEMVLGSDGNKQGVHVAGSAISWYQAATPTTLPSAGTSIGGRTLSDLDKGRLWYDTTGSDLTATPKVYGTMKVYTGVTYGFQPLSLPMTLLAGLSAIPATPTMAAVLALTAQHIPLASPDSLPGAIWIS